jgi:hypothetical protein
MTYAMIDLVKALQGYQNTVRYLKRTTNPEEWESHGDWDKLERDATAAIERAEEDGKCNL